MSNIHTGNQYILGRLDGIRKVLMAVHQSSSFASTNTRGKERESFINLFLSSTLSSQFRIGSGEITDTNGNLSGQIDIVIEYPFLPSIKIPGTSADTRLYLSEGVVAVIEVKSDLAGQWDEVKQTADKVRKIRHRFGFVKGLMTTHIPIFAVGYRGWKKQETVIEHLKQDVVDGILIIEEEGFFIWNHTILPIPQLSGSPTGGWALWGLIVALHKLGMSRQVNEFDLALYARPDLMIIKKLCILANWEVSKEIDFSEFLNSEGINENEGKKILESLLEENFIVNNSENIKITSEAINFAQYINTLH
jgi:hypothetical protein